MPCPALCRVADEESRHLGWCLQRLEELGYWYGCMPAHRLLWEGAEASAHDLGARLAIVPMSQVGRACVHSMPVMHSPHYNCIKTAVYKLVLGPI